VARGLQSGNTAAGDDAPDAFGCRSSVPAAALRKSMGRFGGLVPGTGGRGPSCVERCVISRIGIVQTKFTQMSDGRPRERPMYGGWYTARHSAPKALVVSYLGSVKCWDASIWSLDVKSGHCVQKAQRRPGPCYKASRLRTAGPDRHVRLPPAACVDILCRSHVTGQYVSRSGEVPGPGW